MLAMVSPGKAYSVASQRTQVFSWMLRRIVFSFFVLGGLSVIVFFATELIPGDAVTRRLPRFPEELREQLRRHLGLDQGPVASYFQWLANILSLDMGRSLYSQQPVWPIVQRAVLNSLVLASLAFFVTVPFSMIVGAYAAVHHKKWFDKIASVFTTAGLSMPEFVLGIGLIWLFAVVFPVFPALSYSLPDASLYDRFRSLVLPVLALTPITSAYAIRAMRSSMVRTLTEDYILFAPMKGLSRRRIFWRHALPNATVAVVHVYALNAGWLLGGVVVIEILFGYSGIGLILINSIQSLDVPVIQASALTLGALFVFFNFIADSVVAIMDPRIRTKAMT